MHPAAPSRLCAALVVIDRIKWSPCTETHGRHHRNAQGTGAFVSFGGYLGLTVGWIEGVEINFLGGVLGLDVRRPALKLPGIGRIGMPFARS